MDDQRDEINEIEDANDHFYGTELDEAKMERLNTLRDLCREIAETDPSIKNTYTFFDNTMRNGAVKLDFPILSFNQKRGVLKNLSVLFETADAFVLSGMGESRIRLTFLIHDMWTQHIDDRDRKK